MSRKQYYEDDEHWFCVDKIYGGEGANFVKYYEINIVETFFDEENNATADFCNICRAPIQLSDIPVESFDVTEMPEYWQVGYQNYKKNGSLGLDEYIEAVTKEHLFTKHPTEVALLDTSRSEATIRSIIGDKYLEDGFAP